MSDPSDRSSAGPFTVVLRAAFVPAGEEPPPELAGDFSPLKFRATLDKTTGVITCENAGMSFDGDIQAVWHPAPEQDANQDDLAEDRRGNGGPAPDDDQPD